MYPHLLSQLPNLPLCPNSTTFQNSFFFLLPLFTNREQIFEPVLLRILRTLTPATEPAHATFWVKTTAMKDASLTEDIAHCTMEVKVSSKMMNIPNYTCTVLANICPIDPFPLLRSDLLIPDGNQPSRLQTNPNAPSGSKRKNHLRTLFLLVKKGCLSRSPLIFHFFCLPATHCTASLDSAVKPLSILMFLLSNPLAWQFYLLKSVKHTRAHVRTNTKKADTKRSKNYALRAEQCITFLGYLTPLFSKAAGLRWRGSMEHLLCFSSQSIIQSCSSRINSPTLSLIVFFPHFFFLNSWDHHEGIEGLLFWGFA